MVTSNIPIKWGSKRTHHFLPHQFLWVSYRLDRHMHCKRFKSSREWCYVIGWAVPDISKDHSGFIFRVKQYKMSNCMGK